ncbi:MAG: aspartate aminotransferase family protein, partial [Deltaproteobacteria bacterium]|nr:aspartate aminotransferase family protein [Deltaproteobacteria bacterium]
RNIDYLKHQIFVYENWPGGVFASPAILGTRPGGSIAAAWAAMQAMGREGYLENARAIMKTTGYLIDGVNRIKGLKVLGDPPMSLFAFHSTDKKVNIYAVGDRMEKKGWHIDRQQRPECLHAMVTPLHSDVAARYLTDLAEAVEHVRRHPELATQGAAAMYGMIANVPLRGMIRKEVLKMMTDMYGPDGKMPDLANSELPEDTEDATGQKTDWATKAAMAFVRLKQKFGR